MKAIVLEKIGGPENLLLKEVEAPKPGAGEVRVAIKTSALNRRDLWISIGLYPGIQLPCITGSDGAGVVDMIGDGAEASLLDKEDSYALPTQQKHLTGLILRKLLASSAYAVSGTLERIRTITRDTNKLIDDLQAISSAYPNRLR